MGLSQRQVADESGCISAACLCSWENKIPGQIRAFKSICDVLEISPNALLGYQVKEIDRPGEDPSSGATIIKQPLSNDDLEYILFILERAEHDARDGLSRCRKIAQEDIDFINRVVDIEDKIQAIWMADERKR